jgi:hypothetical protein
LRTGIKAWREEEEEEESTDTASLPKKLSAFQRNCKLA